MRRSALLLTSAAVLVSSLGACGKKDKPTAGELERDISEELRDHDPDLTKRAADCYAGVIIDTLGVDVVNDIDFSASAPDEDDADALATAAIAARDTCRLDAQVAGPAR